MVLKMIIGLSLETQFLTGFTWIQKVVNINKLSFSSTATKRTLLCSMIPLPTIERHQLTPESFYHKLKRDGIQSGVDVNQTPGGL